MYDLNATSIFGRGFEYRAAGVLARTRENVKTPARYVAMATMPTTLLYLLQEVVRSVLFQFFLIGGYFPLQNVNHED